MGSLMKVARMAREYIKPSSPTPFNLKTYKFSLLDQLAPSIYAPMVFFYPMQSTHAEPLAEAVTRTNHLKRSLSPFLTRFYPFAGRINKNNQSIDCNDFGAEFFDAKVVDTSLKDFLEQPNANALKLFLPIDIENNFGSNHLVHIQASTFECGGMALGVCWSHKITDGGTVSAFMRGWSSMSSGLSVDVVPHYVASSLFPPSDKLISNHCLKLATDKTITKRFVFNASKLMELKALGSSQEVPRPTRVEVVSSLLWKCATKASRAKSRSQPLSVMSQSMNIRRRTIPPLPDTTIGNLVGYYVAKMEDNNNDNDNINLKTLVAKQRQGKTEATDNYAKKLLQGSEEDTYLMIKEVFKEAGNLLRRDDVHFFKCLSTCGDGLYDADFGWGKPIWQSLVSLGYKNTFALNQTREGGGIEAWVTLTDDDMSLFENDPELLEFASLNPTVIEMHDSTLNS